MFSLVMFVLGAIFDPPARARARERDDELEDEPMVVRLRPPPRLEEPAGTEPRR